MTRRWLWVAAGVALVLGLTVLVHSTHTWKAERGNPQGGSYKAHNQTDARPSTPGQPSRGVSSGAGLGGLGCSGGVPGKTCTEETKYFVHIDVNTKEYDEWYPGEREGQPILNEEVRGTSITIKARLVDQRGKPQSIADKFVFTLTSSTEPGVCINYPPTATNPPGLDLRFYFDTEESKKRFAVQDLKDGQVAQTVVKGLSEATVNIASYDYGAWGSLGVVAHVKRTPITGLFKGGTEVPLPKIAYPGSKIAERWKGAFLAGWGDDYDSESTPPGDGRVGDGLTLYEEYRGAFVGGTHLRLGTFGAERQRAWGKKKLFLVDALGQLKDTDKALDKVGIAKFQDMSLIRVYELREDEVNPDRVINFNSGTYKGSSGGGGHAQHAVMMKNEALSGGMYGQAQSADDKPGTPEHITKLVLNVGEWEPTRQRWGAAYAQRNKPSRDGELLADQAFVYTVVHELGHCVNIKHHTDSGTNHDEYTLAKKRGCLIALPNGKFSGNWLCPMRYRSAAFYAHPTNTGYDYYAWLDPVWYAQAPTSGPGGGRPSGKFQQVPEAKVFAYFPPMSGDTYEIGPFCNDGSATGRNTERFSAGACASGCGGCFSQIRVRDFP